MNSTATAERTMTLEQPKNAEVAELRREIVESEKARIDLLKYKLVAIAALGAIGIGVYHADPGILRPDFVFILIPFICVYVDSLCWHNTLRILVIAQFLLSHKNRYEEFLVELGEQLKGIGAKALTDKGISEGEKNNSYNSGVDYFFRLEDWALQYSTILICIVLISCGFMLSLLGVLKYFVDKSLLILTNDDSIVVDFIKELHGIIKTMDATYVSMIMHGLVFIVTSSLGMVLSVYIRLQYDKTKNKLFFVTKKMNRSHIKSPE